MYSHVFDPHRHLFACYARTWHRLQNVCHAMRTSTSLPRLAWVVVSRAACTQHTSCCLGDERHMYLNRLHHRVGTVVGRRRLRGPSLKGQVRAAGQAVTDLQEQQQLAEQQRQLLQDAIQQRNSRRAVQLYNQMESEWISERLMNQLLRMLARRGEFFSAWSIFRAQDAAGMGFYYGTLQDLMCLAIKVNEMYAAHRVFRAFNRCGFTANKISYCMLISALCRCKRKGVNSRTLAYELWQELWVVHGSTLDSAAYRTGLNACVSSGHMTEAQQLLEGMVTAGHQPDAQVYNILIKGYGRLGDLTRMQCAYQQMQQQGVQPTRVTYNTMAHIYISSNQLSTMSELLADAERNGVRLDVFGYSAIINGYAKMDMVTEARQVLSDMKRLGVPRNEFSYSGLMDACVRQGDLLGAKELLAEMQADGVTPNTAVYNTLLQAYVSKGPKQKQIREAFKLLTQMRARRVPPDVLTFNTLMTVCINAKEPERAIQVFGRLKRLGYRPDALSYTTLINALSALGKVDECAHVFAKLQQDKAVDVDLTAYNAMVDAYACAGRMEEAGDLVKKALQVAKSAGLPPPREAFGSMIDGFARSRNVQAALEVVKQFYQEGGEPDRGMFDSLVEVCMLTGEFERALQVIRTMERRGEVVDKRRFKNLYYQIQQVKQQYVQQDYGRAVRGTRSIALERFKFWLGLPNNYYQRDWLPSQQEVLEAFQGPLAQGDRGSRAAQGPIA